MRKILAGLVGDGIGPSLTPDLHMAEGRELGLHYEYKRFNASDQETLTKTLSIAAKNGFAGLNVTHPFKQSVVEHLHSLEGICQQMQTANTVVFEQGKAIGWNTDYLGFKEALSRQIGSVEGQFIQVLGAGGAGLAVVLAILDSGAKRVAISDQNVARAEDFLSAVLAIRPNADLELVALDSFPQSVDGIVNCTPMGMASHPGVAVDPTLYKNRTWVADIVYFPQQTQFLQKAKTAGMRTMDGTGMALWQAVHAFKLITGHAPNAPRMQATLMRLLATREGV